MAPSRRGKRLAPCARCTLRALCFGHMFRNSHLEKRLAPFAPGTFRACLAASRTIVPTVGGGAAESCGPQVESQSSKPDTLFSWCLETLPLWPLLQGDRENSSTTCTSLIPSSIRLMTRAVAGLEPIATCQVISLTAPHDRVRRFERRFEKSRQVGARSYSQVASKMFWTPSDSLAKAM